MRDSAGVTIVRSSPPYASRAVGADPVLRIGVVAGDVDQQLSEVGYAGRLSDGRVVLFDGGSSEVRWYDANGRLEARAGGWGEGPEEFRWVVAAALTPEDTLVLYDARNQRLTWAGPDGSIARVRRFESSVGAVTGLIPLGRERLLIVEERAILNIGGSEFNYARDSVVVMLASGGESAV